MTGGVSESGGPGFHTTHWSVVLAAADRATPGSSEALETLCRSYWYPIYAFLRRDGHGVHQAQDLTQEFLARVVERNPFAGIQPSGKFRSFLLVTLKHFVSDQRKRDQALKRGSGQQLISIDAEEAEQRYRFEPVDPLTPEKLFERRWATTVLEQTLKRLQHVHESKGLSELFAALRPCLVGSSQRANYHQIGLQLGQSETAIKGAVLRLRREFGELLRTEIAKTVSDPAEVEEEIRQLITAGMAGGEFSDNLPTPNSL
ncbi:MAG TPA: sigma-70 family RNA polymerase sigma factor [Verrucomicrobiota bacterium]|nr:sigma-70 family RNA polymerase sigma factor [Verrucomicrobiota bacterium]